MNNLIANFVGFDGRVNRQPFWIAAIVLAIIGAVISLVILPLVGLSLMPSLPAITADTTAEQIQAAFGEMQGKARWVGLVMFLIFVYPSAALCIKRRHDRNNSGLDVWIYFGAAAVLQVIGVLGIGMSTMDVGGMAIPAPTPILMGVNIIFGIFAIYLFVVLGFLKGTVGPNTYGPDPLGG